MNTPTDHLSPDFRYTLLSGRTVVLPKFAQVMSFGRARRLRRLDEAEQVFSLVEEVCDEETLAALDEMGQDETGAFFSAWQSDSGVSLGESSSSSPSTTSNETPSVTTGAPDSAPQPTASA